MHIISYIHNSGELLFYISELVEVGTPYKWSCSRCRMPTLSKCYIANTCLKPFSCLLACFFENNFTELFTAVLRIGSATIRIIFQDLDPGSVPRCLGSGSINYSNEHNNINWKETFNKVCLLVGSCWTY